MFRRTLVPVDVLSADAERAHRRRVRGQRLNGVDGADVRPGAPCRLSLPKVKLGEANAVQMSLLARLYLQHSLTAIPTPTQDLLSHVCRRVHQPFGTIAN